MNGTLPGPRFRCAAPEDGYGKGAWFAERWDA